MDIRNWLASLELERYLSAFDDAEIDFATLPDLVEEDLKELGLPLGPRRKVWAAIGRLGPSLATPAALPPETGDPVPASDAERRHLTVMFVDLVGSTEMATRFDAEDMRNVITSYQNTVAGIIGRYQGFVAKFMGDGVLCYFGWPRANEDDAERAVRAGLSIIDGVRALAAPGKERLATRVGIATGVVVVGDLIGSGPTREAAVVGETPNLAARLQGIAGPDQVVLADETRRLLGATYRLRSLGAQRLKGVAAPVEAFEVEGETAVESRFAARQFGALTPIVGREREIELVAERWALARAGQGQMVVVSGEAGIGKSRITRAVIDGIEHEDHIRITYQCSPYHADSAFYPVIQQLSYAAGVAPADGPETRLDKLEALLGDNRDALRLVAPMLGLDGALRYGLPGLTPAQQRAQTMQMLARLLVGQAQDMPVLLIYEDLHWIDPTSLELLDLMLDAIADQRVMILSTTRPTFEHGFGGHPIVTRFALNRLGKDRIGAIVSKLTGGRALPDEIMEIIAQRTDGVPLFVEELTKTILESGALKADGDSLVLNGPLSAIAIPATLHDSLMARLDRLQPIKEVAQTAACIGRAFSHGLLARISHLPDGELTAALDGLIGAELIYRRGLPPEATYLFKHALVRDAAYESLLKDKRRAVHARILTGLEADVDAAPEVLAAHAEAAGLTDLAVDLWQTASKIALTRPAYDEAISHFGRALALIKPLLDGADNPPLERALSLQVPLAMTLLTRRGYGADETIAAFERALVLADGIGDTPLRYPILYGLWIGMGIRGRHKEAWVRAVALLEQAEVSSDSASLVVANRVAGAQRWFMGDVREATRLLDLALALYDPAAHGGQGERFGQDIGVTVHVFGAGASMTRGWTVRAQAHLDEAERIGRQSGHIPSLCYMLLMRSLVSLLDRNYADAARCSTEAAAFAREHNLVVWIGFSDAMREIMAVRDGDADGVGRYLDVDARMTSDNIQMFLTYLRIAMGWSALETGHREEAEKLAAMAQDLSDDTGEAYALPDLHRLHAALARSRGDDAAAEACLTQAIDVARTQGAGMWELRAALDLARLWRDQGRNEKSAALLAPVVSGIDEGDCPEDQAAAVQLLTGLTA